jgi:hypothetical protein
VVSLPAGIYTASAPGAAPLAFATPQDGAYLVSMAGQGSPERNPEVRIPIANMPSGPLTHIG